jgi:hypothetical protein
MPRLVDLTSSSPVMKPFTDVANVQWFHASRCNEGVDDAEGVYATVMSSLNVVRFA